MKTIRKVINWFYRTKILQDGLREIRVLFFKFKYIPQVRLGELLLCEKENKSLKKEVSELSKKRLFDLLPPKKLNRLVMTLMVKNEEDVIEQHIRFHHAMGVDGVIVTAHRCTDNTVPILEKLRDEGLVWEILTKDTADFLQYQWVNDMIHIAIHKYAADWVINSDSDEFWYSKSLDLKTSILKEWPANVIGVDSTFSFPSDDDNWLKNSDFVVKTMQAFEAEMLPPEDQKKVKPYVGIVGGRKAIHATTGFISNMLGNHDVEMENKIKVWSSDIVLYHYRITNYRGWVEKIARYEESIETFGGGGKAGAHMRYWTARFNAGELKNDFDRLYGSDVRALLEQGGCLVHDSSVYNFLVYKGIIKDKDVIG